MPANIAGRIRLFLAPDGDPMPVGLGAYRFASWALTSLFYLVAVPESPLEFRIIVVLCVFLAASLTHRLYFRYRHRPEVMKRLALMEGIGTLLLLIPTGGLASVFIWYAINPILLAATTLPAVWSWAMLAGLTMTIVAVPGFPLALVNTEVPSLSEHAYRALIFGLVTLAAQILVGLVRELKEKNVRLEIQRRDLEKALRIQSALYTLIEKVSSADHPEVVLRLVSQSARTLLGARTVVAWLHPENDAEDHDAEDEHEQASEEVRQGLLVVEGGSLEEGQRRWIKHYIRQRLSPDSQVPLPLLARYENEELGRMLQVPISFSEGGQGFLTVFWGNPEDGNGVTSGSEAADLLQKLAELAAVALERCRLFAVKSRLLRAEEQQRIARELHDGVANELFHISVGCFTLVEEFPHLDPQTVRSRLNEIAQLARKTGENLRASIYRMTQKQEADFFANVRRYLSNLERFHGVRVRAEIRGREDVAGPLLRHALMRVLMEACSNALRHGKCRELQVQMIIHPRGGSLLRVKDDGDGFKVTARGDRRVARLGSPLRGGTGLENMRRLAEQFHGEFIIHSKVGEGTCVEFRVPPQTSNFGQVADRNAERRLEFRVTEAMAH